MGKPRTDPLAEVEFECLHCRRRFSAVPESVEENLDAPWHPFTYRSICPGCGYDAEQSARERGLLKAWAHATGPRTPEGKANTAKNLEGHPTPEEALRTRFNAMKHGMAARVATYFPAKPGKYPHCEGCEYFNRGCNEFASPADNPPGCLKRTELFMRHQVAFDSQDPKLLLSLRSDTQAALQAIIDDMILAVAASGVELRSPEWAINPHTGEIQIADYVDQHTGERRVIHKVQAHPLLKPLIDYISKNNLTLSDMGMTPKVQEDQDMMRGFLEGKQKDEQGLVEFQRDQTQLLESLREQIDRSRASAERDPVLIEHRGGEE